MQAGGGDDDDDDDSGGGWTGEADHLVTSTADARPGSADGGDSGGARATNQSGAGTNRVERAIKQLQFNAPGVAFRAEDRHYVSRRRRVPVSSNAVSIPNYRPHHNNVGALVLSDGTTVNVCDCLKRDCRGCFSECPDCGGRRCGPSCQQNREYAITKCVPSLNAQDSRKMTTTNPYIGH